jgi:two-component system sensor histidine kinase KdpD
MTRAYGGAALLVFLATAVAWLMMPYLAPTNLVMVYLLGVLLVAARFGRGPSLLASVMSVAAFDFFFVPPHFTFAVADTQYLVTFAVMLAVALVISDLATRIRAQADASRERERRTAALYAMSRDLGRAGSVTDVLAASGRHIGDVFASEVAFLLPGPDGALTTLPGTGSSFDPDASDRTVARRVFDERRPAGLGTTSARALYLPLLASRGAIGVLGVRPADVHAFDSSDQLHQLETFANQTALALERARLAEEAHEAGLRVETERLRSSLLSSVSHDLRTPLATITGAASVLLGTDGRMDDTTKRELLESVRDEAERLNRLVQNLLEMTRLESGALQLHRDWHPVEEIVGAALRRLGKRLAGRRIDVRLAPDLPLVLMDDVLVEQILINLLDNALKYTPPGTAIGITGTVSDGRITVEVADHGPGLRPGEEERVFDKFYRSPRGSERGAGLGLAICKGIVQAHGGRVWAHALPEGGAAFFFTLPVTEPPPVENRDG